MNFLQLVQRLRQECGVSGSAPSTTVGQSGEIGKLVSWINTAWMEIQEMHPDWNWMRTTYAFPTSAASNTYSPASIGITDFGSWARDTFRNYQNPQVTISIAAPGVFSLIGHGLSVGQTVTPFTTGALPGGLSSGSAYYVVSTPTADTFTVSATSGGSPITTTGTQSGVHTLTSNSVNSFVGFLTEMFMSYIDYEQWRDVYFYDGARFARTRPSEITITPQNGLAVGPLSDGNYTVIGSYFRVPTEMALDADIPAMPTQYHMAIVYKAMMYYGAFENAPEVYQSGEMNFTRMSRRLNFHQMPTIGFGPPLA